MRTTLLQGLVLAVALAGSAGAAQHVAAHSAMPAIVAAPDCTAQTARFSVQVSQGISIFSPKRLVVYGTCFAQGAVVEIYDYTAGALLTDGWVFVPSAATGAISYVVPGAKCYHLLLVVVQDVAHNTRAGGNGKTYGPCQTPPPGAPTTARGVRGLVLLRGLGQRKAVAVPHRTGTIRQSGRG